MVKITKFLKTYSLVKTAVRKCKMQCKICSRMVHKQEKNTGIGL